MSKINTYFLIGLCLTIALHNCKLKAQTGNYYITNYSPSQYGASDQNWSSIQDEYGRVYVANNSGILLNDGNGWKTIKIKSKDQGRCISLDKNSNNKIFVGGENEFGYLKTSSRGQIEYRSLSESLPEKDANFDFVWATHCIGDEVFFCSNKKLFWYKDGKIKSFSPESEGFHTFFKVGNHLFVREKQVGFKVFMDGELKKIEDTEIFANQRVDFILPFKKNTYWVGTRNNGMYVMVYDNELPWKSVFSKIKTPIDDWLSKNELYCGTKIDESTYALGSIRGGMLFVDLNFRFLKSITDNDGLIDNGVKNIFVDWNRNIWLSLNYGVALLEYNTPITHWTKNNGINGVVENSIKYKGNLYIATDNGLQVLDPVRNKFIDTEIGGQTWALLVKDKILFVGSTKGLYSIDNGKPKVIYSSGIYSIFSDPNNSKLLYLGTDQGLVIAEYKNGKLDVIRIFDDWGDVRSAGVNKEGLIGFGTSSNGVYVLNPDKNYNYDHLTTEDGLPSLTENFVFSYSGELFIGAEKGLYKIINTSTTPTCLKMNNLNSLALGKFIVTRAVQINNDMWFHAKVAENQTTSDMIRSVELTSSGVAENHFMLHRIKGADTKHFMKDSNRIYISTNNGLYCYDNSITPKYNSFYTFISELSFKNDTSLILQNISGSGIAYSDINMPYSSNEFRAIPAASDYYDIGELKYAYYLEGKEEKFGHWYKAPDIIYNNLQEGSYVFHLKAKNIMGHEGKEVTFAFTILPPWYRTFWAYILYVILGVLFIWLIVMLNTKRLKEQNIRLEKIITERTQTIANQKTEIEYKNREITDSINYAKRIQEAILPSISDIKNTWKDIFVFFQPKAIVSGDFYWYYKINEHEFLIGVADCTGHGVPGGFMSMICTDKLNEAVSVTTVPSEILHYANNKIKNALKQNEEDNSTKDGMEMGLLRVNTKSQEIAFAGAYRSLWIVRNNSTVIEEIKPTKASIASSTKHDFSYKLNTLQLAKGDNMYISSDGYPDQFGGPKGKKYMTANFKKFILSLQNYSMQQQNSLVGKNINEWMQGYEQVDDLLVIGVKL